MGIRPNYDSESDSESDFEIGECRRKTDWRGLKNRVVDSGFTRMQYVDRIVFLGFGGCCLCSS